MSRLQNATDNLAAIGVTTSEVDPQSASDAEWQAIHQILNWEREENWPDDPPRELDDIKKSLLNIPPFMHIKGRLTYQDGQAIGFMHTGYLDTEENQHLMQFEIYLQPEARRKGIGSLLLHWAIAEAADHTRRLLITGTSSKIPEGEAFMEAVGAQMALSNDVNQLNIVDLDHALLDHWIARASERSGDLVLGIWDGPYPEEEIEAVAEMKRTMNTAPTDDLDIEDFNVTPEHLRAIEKSLGARGVQRWTFYVRDPANGAFAGYTELYWRPSKPNHLEQGDTAVVPTYRNRGIGRWLKAAALKDVLKQRPNTKLVRTGNATSNEGMLKINHEMGFRLYITQKNWQVERSTLERYVGG